MGAFVAVSSTNVKLSSALVIWRAGRARPSFLDMGIALDGISDLDRRCKDLFGALFWAVHSRRDWKEIAYYSAVIAIRNGPVLAFADT